MTLAAPNTRLDAAVRTVHDWDGDRAEWLIDHLGALPRRREARRLITALLEQAREQGATCPAVAFEIAYRRGVAEGAALEDEQLEQLDRQRRSAVST